MLGILFTLSFFLLAFQAFRTSLTNDLREAYLASCVLTSVVLVAIVEVLSLTSQLKTQYVILSWGLACLLFFITLRKVYGKRYFKSFALVEARKWISSKQLLKSLTRNLKDVDFWVVLYCCLTFSVILLVTFVIALLFPPNTYDSMTYHMSRVVHWIVNQSIAHYPTSISRQLDSPPFSEFVILHFQILLGNDYLANYVQWLSFLGSCLGTSLIVGQLGGSNKAQAIAVFLCATIPMGIMQASSTQNDYVTAFWLICFVYFSIAWVDNSKQTSYILLFSSSLGLAILTKGTAYIYSLPLLAMGFALLISCPAGRRARPWISVITLLPVTVILLNGPHWIRNFIAFGHPLGISGDITRTNDLNLSLFISNLFKNSTLHAVFPIPEVNRFILSQLQNLHILLGISLNDPRTNFFYTPDFAFPAYEFDFFHEDFSGNLILFLILNISIVSVFFLRHCISGRAVIYATSIVGSILLYSYFVAWQPWASRLHLPIFVLATPLLAIVVDTSFSIIGNKSRLVLLALLVLVSLSSAPYLFSNKAKPLDSLAQSSRSELYFINIPHLYEPYSHAISYLNQINCYSVGLFFSINTVEYPLWTLSGQSNYPDRKFFHLVVDKEQKTGLARIAENKNEVCAILVSSEFDAELLEAEEILIGERFLNRSKKFDSLAIFSDSN